MNRLIESRPETPDKWEDWPDEAIEIRLSVSSVAGHASELKALADDLNEAAAAKFAASKDDIAHFLRDELVPKLRRREQKQRDRQVRLYKDLGSIFDSAERRAPQGEDGDG